jgi:hypothetical protein
MLATLKEDRAPTLADVAAKFQVVTLASHASHDVANAAPVVEASMPLPKFELALFKREKPQRGTQELAAGV